MTKLKQLWIAWLKLLRIPAVFSAASNIVAAAALSQDIAGRFDSLLLLIGSSCCLYLAGMVLNDVCDYRRDLEQNPKRPLPSKQISRTSAFFCYVGLTMAGLMLAWANSVESLMIAAALVVAISTYDYLLKPTRFAPPVMGLCRSLNIVLGSTLNGLDFQAPVLVYAIAVGLLITGLTYFARNESRLISKSHLRNSSWLMAIGVVSLFGLIQFSDSLTVAAVFSILMLVTFSQPLASIYQAVAVQEPKSVRRAVISTLQSLILLDASVCYLACPSQVFIAIAVAGLLLPARWLGRWISAT